MGVSLLEGNRLGGACDREIGGLRGYCWLVFVRGVADRQIAQIARGCGININFDRQWTYVLALLV